MLTKVFKSGNSQAVRIPKNMAFSGKNVEIKKVGQSVIISEKIKTWDDFFNGLYQFSSDFMPDGRCEPMLDKRTELKWK